MSDCQPQVEPPEPLNQWVRDHARAVRGYLLGMVRHGPTADDLVQEAFRRAWEARDRYRENGHARAYLLRIADRLACDWLRRADREVTVTEKRWQQLAPTDSAPGPAEILEKDEARQRLAAALDSLTPPQRRVLLLRYYGEFDFATIARMTGCPLNTALSHCRRGLKALRKLLPEGTT